MRGAGCARSGARCGSSEHGATLLMGTRELRRVAPTKQAVGVVNAGVYYGHLDGRRVGIVQIDGASLPLGVAVFM